MTGILDLLPLLRGWRYDVKDINIPEVVIGKKEIFRATDEKGWVVAAGLFINNRNAVIQVTLDGYHRANSSPIAAFSAGLVMPSAAGFWIGHYDAVLDLYNAFFTPPYPWWYTKSIVVELTPPTGVPVILFAYAHLIIRIDDEKEFRKSLKELGGGI